VRSLILPLSGRGRLASELTEGSSSFVFELRTPKLLLLTCRGVVGLGNTTDTPVKLTTPVKPDTVGDDEGTTGGRDVDATVWVWDVDSVGLEEDEVFTLIVLGGDIWAGPGRFKGVKITFWGGLRSVNTLGEGRSGD